MTKTTFTPSDGHILIEPEEITLVAKTVTRDDGTIAKIEMSHHTQDKIVAAVNKGMVVAVSEPNKYIIGQTLIYYPFSPNKIKMNDKDYHVIHERDVMGKVETFETE